jgi:hypothetical protein
MSAVRSPLTITYTGEPVRVNPDRVTEAMYVPNLGYEGALHADDLPSRAASALFAMADAEGAFVLPAGLDVDCYGDDDAGGGVFILVAHPVGDCRAGVTCGWRDVEHLARRDGDGRLDNDATVVTEALGLMAGEINAALNLRPAVPAGLRSRLNTRWRAFTGCSMPGRRAGV